ncbi:hypothetical protein HYW74_03235 [Candidatus Pacearchaeota archaeon]|nr:hypothetical protein [Candidatus Pacearchaeota archaeon]
MTIDKQVLREKIEERIQLLNKGSEFYDKMFYPKRNEPITKLDYMHIFSEYRQDIELYSLISVYSSITGDTTYNPLASSLEELINNFEGAFINNLTEKDEILEMIKKDLLGLVSKELGEQS